MGPGLIVAAVIVLLVLIWVIANYNGLVRLTNLCDESWSDIDTELRRRYDLIPNLVNTVKGYAAHERDTFTQVIEARNKAFDNHGSPKSQAQDENMLVSALRQIFALAEGYPELKASTNFLELQEQLTHTEDRIQRARRFYNANVRELNTKAEVFPSNLIASVFKFSRREFFEIEDAAVRQVPHVDLQ